MDPADTYLNIIANMNLMCYLPASAGKTSAEDLHIKRPLGFSSPPSPFFVFPIRGGAHPSSYQKEGLAVLNPCPH